MKSLIKFKNGQVKLGDLPGLGMTIGITALIIGVLVLVLNSVDTQTAASIPQNPNLTESAEVFGNGSLAGINISSNLPLIGTIVALAVVLGIVIVAFGRKLVN